MLKTSHYFDTVPESGFECTFLAVLVFTEARDQTSSYPKFVLPISIHVIIKLGGGEFNIVLLLPFMTQISWQEIR